MADKSFAIAMLLKPILGAAFLFGVYGGMWLLWKKLPDGWFKRLLFLNLWGKESDLGPWARDKPKDVHIGRIVPEEPTALPQYRSPEAAQPQESQPPPRQ